MMTNQPQRQQKNSSRLKLWIALEVCATMKGPFEKLRSGRDDEYNYVWGVSLIESHFWPIFPTGSWWTRQKLPAEKLIHTGGVHFGKYLQTD